MSYATILIFISLPMHLQAQKSIPLIDADQADQVWNLSNGAGFSAAQGTLAVIPDAGGEGMAPRAWSWRVISPAAVATSQRSAISEKLRCSRLRSLPEASGEMVYRIPIKD